MAVRFIGRRSIKWDPTLTPPTSTEDVDTEPDAALPPTDERFIAFIRTKLDCLQHDTLLSQTERAKEKKWLLAVLNIALDPTAEITGVTPVMCSFPPEKLEGYFTICLEGLIRLISMQTDSWLISKNAKKRSRESADVKAQKDVPTFYNNRCILTGTIKPQGAHIVPVRSRGIDHNKTWSMLRALWPLPAIENLVMHGRERENIFPLTHTIHAMWDCFFFGIRPIAHPTDPLHRIFIQMVWLKDMNGNRVVSDWDHPQFGSTVVATPPCSQPWNTVTSTSW
ncbi:hypothetical protein GGS23DRAFT_585184 [Durotheca rogersii]|uniref:uncharacterized protein n=1 Tax=Durotheca rogersii TaxID=419775 RepID=UPI00221EF576|nr:uncharacterized protein GGS23DRAFT_585184 [Durotheca rogersii]KAI5859600.1 hypothetical protein GGS23DRAFT_585184 [Durotheca rogersii]